MMDRALYEKFSDTKYESLVGVIADMLFLQRDRFDPNTLYKATAVKLEIIPPDHGFNGIYDHAIQMYSTQVYRKTNAARIVVSAMYACPMGGFSEYELFRSRVSDDIIKLFEDIQISVPSTMTSVMEAPVDHPLIANLRHKILMDAL